MVDGGDGSFKRPGAVPFNWEIRPGVPKTLTHDPSLLRTPNNLSPLKLIPPPSPSSSSASSFISDSKSLPNSPLAPLSSFKLKSPSDSDSHCSGPPSPYFRSSSPRAGPNSRAALPRWWFPKSLFGLKKKSKAGDVKKTGQESTSESDNFYESETTFFPSEGSSQESVSGSTRWGSPKSSFSPLKRAVSDLSSNEKKAIIMMAQSRLG